MSADLFGPWPSVGPALANHALAGLDHPRLVAAVVCLVPDPPPERAPWAGWTRWLAARIGLSAAEPLGLAVALVGVAGPVEPADLLLAAGLDGVELHTLLPHLAASRGAGGPAALAFGLPLAVAGVDLPVASAAALSALAALLEGRVRTWLHPGGPDLEAPQDNALLAHHLADPEVGPRLRLALAGRVEAVPRQVELLDLLASPGARNAEARAWQEALDRARAVAAHPGLAEWVEAMARGGAHVRDAATFRGLAASVAPRSAPPDAVELDRCEQAAVAFLLRPGGLQSTWEVQRWGVGEHGGLLTSRCFPEGVVLQALHEAGFDQRAPIAALLDTLPVELRWYVAGPGPAGAVWRGIPPDADSLGLMLQLEALAPALPPGRAEGWLSWLRASLPPDQRLPTWFYTAPDGGPSIEGPAWQYASNDCTTVRLTCMTGLLLSELPGSLDLVAANLPVVLPCFEAPGRTGDFFYTPATAELYFLRFAERWRRGQPGHPLTDRVLACARGLAHRIAQAQQLDGGWGDAHETALRLEGLALWPTGPEPLRLGLRFLAEHQRPDGAWAAAPFYLMPGKTLHHVDYLASYEVSTALCLRAMHAARASLGGTAQPEPRRMR